MLIENICIDFTYSFSFLNSVRNLGKQLQLSVVSTDTVPSTPSRIVKPSFRPGGTGYCMFDTGPAAGAARHPKWFDDSVILKAVEGKPE